MGAILSLAQDNQNLMQIEALIDFLPYTPAGAMEAALKRACPPLISDWQRPLAGPGAGSGSRGAHPAA